MDGPGQGSPPAEFGLEGFEEDPERVKDAVAGRRNETGGHDDPAVEKPFFSRRTHGFLDPVKTLSNGGWKSNGVPAPPFAESCAFAGLSWQARMRKLGYNTCRRLFRLRTHRVFDPKLSP